MSLRLALTATVLSILVSSSFCSVEAAELFDFSYSFGTYIMASGTFTATSNGNGTYTVTSISGGTRNGTALTLLSPSSLNSSYGVENDNILKYPGNTATETTTPPFTTNGIAFSAGGNDYDIHLFNNNTVETGPGSSTIGITFTDSDEGAAPAPAPMPGGGSLSFIALCMAAAATRRDLILARVRGWLGQSGLVRSPQSEAA